MYGKWLEDILKIGKKILVEAQVYGMEYVSLFDIITMLTGFQLCELTTNSLHTTMADQLMERSSFMERKNIEPQKLLGVLTTLYAAYMFI